MEDLMLGNEIEITSLDIAEWTGKEHKHVIRDIRKEMESLGEIGQTIFGQSSYLNSQNKPQPCFTMNRDGVMQLALKYDATSRYKCILKLKELDKPKQYTLKESLRMNLELLESNEKLQLENKQQQKQIEEDKPKVEFSDTVSITKDCLNMGKYAKMLYDDNGIDVGRNRLYSWLKDSGYLMNDRTPYQKYMQYFKVIEKTYYDNKGEARVQITTLINGKGQLYFFDKIKNHFGFKK